MNEFCELMRIFCKINRNAEGEHINLMDSRTV